MLTITNPVRFFLIVVVAAAALATAARVSATVTLESPAAHIMLVDADTGTVLPRERRRRAGAAGVDEQTHDGLFGLRTLANGSLSLSDTFPVSEYAWRMGGSKMFVRINSRVSVEDLLYGVIVQSGNDASIVDCRGPFGDREDFRLRNDASRHPTWAAQ